MEFNYKDCTKITKFYHKKKSDDRIDSAFLTTYHQSLVVVESINPLKVLYYTHNGIISNKHITELNNALNLKIIPNKVKIITSDDLRLELRGYPVEIFEGNIYFYIHENISGQLQPLRVKPYDFEDTVDKSIQIDLSMIRLCYTSKAKEYIDFLASVGLDSIILPSLNDKVFNFFKNLVDSFKPVKLDKIRVQEILQTMVSFLAEKPAGYGSRHYVPAIICNVGHALFSISQYYIKVKFFDIYSIIYFSDSYKSDKSLKGKKLYLNVLGKKKEIIVPLNFAKLLLYLDSLGAYDKVFSSFEKRKLAGTLV